MDCDAFGQYFDDYAPGHRASRAQDCAARVDRMKWIANILGGRVGSEGGFALAASAICFGHGVLTPAIGWGDKDLTNEHSPWWLGGYWPPEAPQVFFMAAPLKAHYRIESYDPRFRLPLYEVVFHDCVVATHHWSSASLKFKGLEDVTALMEQLYNVPPLYHFTRDEFARHRQGILAHYRFFSPLHRRLAYQPLAGFRWLTPDRLVQVTVFGDGTKLIGNFGTTSWRGEGVEVAAGTILALTGSSVTTYRPVY